MAAQGDVHLVQDPVARALLQSRAMARVAYSWTDGSPRVVPMWFHWDGAAVVLGSPPAAPKLRALEVDLRVAVTIDGTEWPYQVLLLRGRAVVDVQPGVTAEYAAAAQRYFGAEQGRAWVEPLRHVPMARIRIAPEWVAVLDFGTRFPSAVRF